MQQTRVALIGLGLMGSGMARRLLGAGFPLTVWNRNPERARALASEGAHVAATPREAAARADVVLSMVADDAASRAVWLGDDGALAGAIRGAVLVESSTLTVGWIGELFREVAARGLDRAKSLELLTGGAPGSPLVKTLSARMAARDYTPNFLLRLMAKDLSYALGEGRRYGLALSTVASALEVVDQAVAAGNGEEDFSALVEPLRRPAGETS